MYQGAGGTAASRASYAQQYSRLRGVNTAAVQRQQLDSAVENAQLQVSTHLAHYDWVGTVPSRNARVLNKILQTFSRLGTSALLPFPSVMLP
jgi:hypothetical protein